MTGTIKVSPEKLIATSQEFSTQGSTINNLTAEMINRACELSSGWEGEAAQSYITKFKSLEADIQIINNMIQEHVNDLQEMASLYSAAEQSNVDDAMALSSAVLS